MHLSATANACKAAAILLNMAVLPCNWLLSLCLQAKECMLFAGTAVASGSGIGVVTSIGMSTEIGKIQSQIAAASEEEEDTPLKQKLDEFGELLAKVRGQWNVLIGLLLKAGYAWGACCAPAPCLATR